MIAHVWIFEFSDFPTQLPFSRDRENSESENFPLMPHVNHKNNMSSTPQHENTSTKTPLSVVKFLELVEIVNNEH